MVKLPSGGNMRLYAEVLLRVKSEYDLWKYFVSETKIFFVRKWISVQTK